MKGHRWHPQPCTTQVRQCPAFICLSLSQFGLLTGLGSLGLMVWLTATPHSHETEQKRLGMLVGFAFLTGRWALGLPPTSHGTPNPAEGLDEAPQNGCGDTQFSPSRHQSGTSPANVHLHQPQVGDTPTDPVPHL